MFRGRTSHSEFWLFCLVYLPIISLLVVLTSRASNLVALMTASVLMVSVVAAGNLRLQDTDLDGYLIFFPRIIFPLFILLLAGPLQIGFFGEGTFGYDLRNSTFWVIVAFINAICAVLIGIRIVFPSAPEKNFFGPNTHEVST